MNTLTGAAVLPPPPERKGDNMIALQLQELRGKKANRNRWEALKMLDWEKDFLIIQRIFSVKNPRFFSSRTPEEVISSIKEDIEFENRMKQIRNGTSEAL